MMGYNYGRGPLRFGLPHEAVEVKKGEVCRDVYDRSL